MIDGWWPLDHSRWDLVGASSLSSTPCTRLVGFKKNGWLDIEMYHVPVPGQLHRGSACRVLLHQKETGINTKQLYWSCARRNYNYIGHICHLYTPTCVTCLIVKADDARWNPINIRQNSVQAYADYQRRVNMFFPGPRREWCISRCKYGQINNRHLCICCESELRAHTY